MEAIHVSGKRKKAIARASLRVGTGIIRVNNQLFENITPDFVKLKVSEPLILAGDAAKKVNIDVNVRGGGQVSQAAAVRLAIAKALSVHDESLRRTFLDYDRTLLVADVRRNEPAKPNSHGKARSKVQKSYR